MDLYEYQAKELLEKYGVPIARRILAVSVQDVLQAIDNIGSFPVVLKAQVLCGDRAASGGVQIVRSLKEAEKAASLMFGRTLISRQTGITGQVIRKLLVHEYLEIHHEYYCALLLDREQRKLVFMYSREGGCEIEETAAQNPDIIYREYLNPCFGLFDFQARNMARQLGLENNLVRPAIVVFNAMYRTFVQHDCSLIEINPLVVTPESRLFALDAKIRVDDNALFRRPELFNMRETGEPEPVIHHGLQYIKLDGCVGCMVNGAGLAMATMDLIKSIGYAPANFLDIGGAASVETIKNGFKILLDDKNVRIIFINIFGGIVRCDRVAKGILEALEGKILNVPLVIRLAGTNADLAGRLLNQSERNFKVIYSLTEAAEAIHACLKNRG